MAKFNNAGTKPAVFSPITSEPTPSGRTYEGGAGYVRDSKSELFLLAVANFVGEHTFYESGSQRDSRYDELVREVALTDAGWLLRFLTWLRTRANMRSAALVGAAIAVHARLAAQRDKHPTDEVVDDTANRAIINAVLQRADEPGELLAFWTSQFSRAIPKPVKRGVADAVARLYAERSYLKWDSDARGFRFADVLDLCHPKAQSAWQSDLFKHILDERHGHADEVPASLPMLRRRAELMRLPVDERRGTLRSPELLEEAGMTWESLAGWLQGPMDATAWQAMIPSMGLMALTRNLRNFDEAGVPDAVAAQVAAKLADAEQVAKSRQLPMRFLSAHRAVPSLRWAYALEQALTHSLANVPRLDGRTLILVDTSDSMAMGFSKDGTLMRWDAAAVFGIALGSRCAHADVVSFSESWRARRGSKVFSLRAKESLLKSVDRWKSRGFFLGGGTDTVGAVTRHLRPRFHDRLVILTDEQAAYGDVGEAVPESMPLYTWNLAGYRHGHAPSGSRNRHVFGGLSDAAFGVIPLLEAGRSADWDTIFSGTGTNS